MRTSPRAFLLSAAGCAGLFCLVLVMAYGSPPARELDAHALWAFQDYTMYLRFKAIGRLGDADMVLLQGAALAVVGLLRGRPRLALAVMGLLAVTALSSQLLQGVLAYPRAWGRIGYAAVWEEAFPSGHATAAMALAIAAVLVVPSGGRLLAALLGGASALAVGFALVASGAHFPSDVLGGFLLAAWWGMLMALALLWADGRWPEREWTGRLSVRLREVTEAAVTVGLAACVGAAAVLLTAVAIAVAVTTPDAPIDFARERTSALLTGLALAALAAGLLGGIALMVRQARL